MKEAIGVNDAQDAPGGKMPPENVAALKAFLASRRQEGLDKKAQTRSSFYMDMARAEFKRIIDELGFVGTELLAKETEYAPYVLNARESRTECIALLGVLAAALGELDVAKKQVTFIDKFLKADKSSSSNMPEGLYHDAYAYPIGIQAASNAAVGILGMAYANLFNRTDPTWSIGGRMPAKDTLDRLVSGFGTSPKGLWRHTKGSDDFIDSPTTLTVCILKHLNGESTYPELEGLKSEIGFSIKYGLMRFNNKSDDAGSPDQLYPTALYGILLCLEGKKDQAEEMYKRMDRYGSEQIANERISGCWNHGFLDFKTNAAIGILQALLGGASLGE